MTRKLKKVLALLLTLSMVMSMVTVGAMAVEGEDCPRKVLCGGKGTVIYVDEVAPTCERKGVVAHWMCTACGRNFYRLSGDLTHTLNEYPGEVTRIPIVSCDYSIPATCMSPATCKWCGAEKPNGTVNPNNHAEGCTLSDWITTDTEHYKEYSLCRAKAEQSGHVAIGVPVAPATCEHPGTTDGTKCSTCDKVLSGVEVDPQKEHSYTGGYVNKGDAGHTQKCVNGCDGEGEVVAHSGEWVKTGEPSCTQEGQETQTCMCGHVSNRPIDKLDHKDENKDNVCDDCGATICEHVWDDGVQTKAPTYKEEGEKTFTCSKCGATKTEKIEKLVCEHKTKTIKNNGTTHTVTCDTCKETLVNREKHTFNEEDYTCTVCGAEAVARIEESGELYTTLQLAINNATNGTTVKVLKDVTTKATVSNKTITLNLNGKTVIGLENSAVLTINGGEVTLTGNGTIQGSGNNHGVLVQGGGTVNIVDGTFNGYRAVVGLNKATINVTGENVSINGTNTGIHGEGKDVTVLVNAGEVKGGKFGLFLNKGASGTVEGTAKLSRTLDDNSGMTISLKGPGGDDDTVKHTTLIVNGGTITNTKNAAIAGNGTVTDKGDARHTKITINGGTITSTESWAIYHPQVGEMTINGGIISGITGIEMRAGTLNIPGSSTTVITGNYTLNGTYYGYSHTANGNGATTMAVGIALSQHTTERPINAVIAGGEITGYHAIVEHDLQNDNPSSAGVTLRITGGKFTAVGDMNAAKKDSDLGGNFADRGSLAYGEPTTVVSQNLANFITGGYFSNDVSNTEDTKYVADIYVSHPVSTYEGYFNVHKPTTQEGWSHDDAGHWTTCVGHDDCLVIVTEKADHIWNNGEVTTEPTYTTLGVRTFTCTTCGHTRTEDIPMVERPSNPGTPTTYYTLTINYVDAEGNTVAETVTRRLAEGSTYNVASPTVEGMTPDQETVTGTLNRSLTVTVTYTPVEDVETTTPPLTETPEPTESTEPTETEEPGETEDLGENDTPLTGTPDETEDPNAGEESGETEELGENDTPLANVPQTGDMFWLWIVLALSSAAGLVWISLEEKKGKRVA